MYENKIKETSSKMKLRGPEGRALNQVTKTIRSIPYIPQLEGAYFAYPSKKQAESLLAQAYSLANENSGKHHF